MPFDSSAPLLTYAPPARQRYRWVVVVLAGLLTTALAEFAATWVDRDSKGDLDLWGLYVYGIVPMGALLVGLAAASGYAGAAWVLGVRIKARLLCGIALITLLAYFSMHWLEFKSRGPLLRLSTNLPLGFWEYFDLTTRSMRFVSTMAPPPTDPFKPPEPEETLGVLGYGVRLLELGGFMLGTLVMPLMLRGKRYCDLCERYHQEIRLAVIPASVPLKKTLGIIRPRNVTLDGEHAVAAERAVAVADQLSRSITALDVSSIQSALSELRAGSKAAKKLPRRIEVLLSRCPRCGQGIFHPTLVTGIDSRNTAREELCTIDVPPAVADAIRPRRRVSNTQC